MGVGVEVELQDYRKEALPASQVILHSTPHPCRFSCQAGRVSAVDHQASVERPWVVFPVLRCLRGTFFSSQPPNHLLSAFLTSFSLMAILSLISTLCFMYFIMN
jgi:hypothetical protein